MANNYRESTYSLNMRPAFDPVKFPQTVNTGDYFLSYAPPKTPDQVQPTTLSGVPLPNKYAAGSTARSYAYELALAPDHQVLSKHQAHQTSANQSKLTTSGAQASAVYQEIIHEDRAVKVISRADIEEPWRNKCALLEKQIYELQQENQRYRGLNQTSEKVTYYEDTQRVNQLMQEVDRLNKVTIDLNNEIATWQDRYKSLELQLKSRSNVEQEIERMRRALQDNENVMQMEMNRLREQLEESQRKYISLEAQNQQNKQNLQKSMVNEQQILSLQSEIKKLELSLRAKTEEYDQLEQKQKRLERVVRDSEYQNQEMATLRRIIDERNKEIEQLRKTVNQGGNAKEAENKLAIFQAECERLNQLLQAKDQEILYYKDQLKRQSHYSNYSNSRPRP